MSTGAKAKVWIPAWPILVMPSWANDFPIELRGSSPIKGDHDISLVGWLGKMPMAMSAYEECLLAWGNCSMNICCPLSDMCGKVPEGVGRFLKGCITKIVIPENTCTPTPTSSLPVRILSISHSHFCCLLLQEVYCTISYVDPARLFCPHCSTTQLYILLQTVMSCMWRSSLSNKVSSLERD